jgi:undecaprenyl-diphosphatase
VGELDHDLDRYVLAHREDWLDPLFVGLSIAGSGALVWLALAGALTVLRRSAGPFLLVAATALVSNLVVTGLKHAVGRERPPAVILDPKPLMEVPTTSSFPSGHAATSFACALIMARLAPGLTIPLFVLAALIAFSRVYVGVHYPFDVLAGTAVGLTIATALPRLLTALRRSRPARQGG